MKKNIPIMYAISFLQGMVFYASIATLYRQVWGVTMFQIMLIESVSLVLGVMLEVPWGFLADRIGYKKTMILCTGLYAVSKVVFWQATGFGWFLAERVLLSVVTSGLSGVDSSILYLSCETGKSQRVFGIFDSLGTMGMILATLIFSFFVKENYKLSALLTVVTYSAAAVLPFFLTEVREEGIQERDSARELLGAFTEAFRSPLVLVFLLGASLLTEMQWAVTVMLNQVQYEKCGMSVGSIGFVYVAASVLELSSALSEGFTKKLGERSALLVIGLLSVAACSILAATETAWISVICILTIVTTCSLFGPLCSELKNRQVTSPNRATVLSIFAIITDCVGIGTNTVFGALADWNVSVTFGAGAVISAVSVTLLMVWYGKYEKG